MSSVTVSVDGASIPINGIIKSTIGICWGVDSARNCGYRVRCLSNNQAELLAAYAAIKRAIEYRYSEVIIETDSQYVQRIFSSWIHVWKSNSWKTSKRKAVKNQALIRSIDDLGKIIDVKYIWKRGHSNDNPLNKLAHNLATAALHDEGALYYEVDDKLLI